ncbi:putative motility protein [Clostridium manihotivorum]|uniref:Putative motility protein n=2 Tax=Clostridium manihotivorum TaxID=2320868 RepID=A0A3R5VCQ6_9CLOT|nr:putative motility protein [Clostridium manihotivorum]
MITDIANLSITMKQENLSQEVGTELTKKTIDTSKDDAQALIKMMELSVNPNVGIKLDVKA